MTFVFHLFPINVDGVDVIISLQSDCLPGMIQSVVLNINNIFMFLKC